MIVEVEVYIHAYIHTYIHIGLISTFHSPLVASSTKCIQYYILHFFSFDISDISSSCSR